MDTGIWLFATAAFSMASIGHFSILETTRSPNFGTGMAIRVRVDNPVGRMSYEKPGKKEIVPTWLALAKPKERKHRLLLVNAVTRIFNELDTFRFG